TPADTVDNMPCAREAAEQRQTVIGPVDWAGPAPLNWNVRQHWINPAEIRRRFRNAERIIENNIRWHASVVEASANLAEDKAPGRGRTIVRQGGLRIGDALAASPADLSQAVGDERGSDNCAADANELPL